MKVLILKVGGSMPKGNSSKKCKDGASLTPIGDGISEFKGPSHADGGIPFSYEGSKVEVEGKETLHEDENGVDVMSAKVKMPGTNKTYASISKLLAEKENKVKKLIDKGTALVNAANKGDKWELLKFNSGEAMMKGGTKKLMEIEQSKDHLVSMQRAGLEHANELGVDPEALFNKGIYKKANPEFTNVGKNGLVLKAQNGATIKKKDSAAVRHNNPGNIMYGDWAKRHGATQGDPRPKSEWTGPDKETPTYFAKFPSVEEGLKAMAELFTGPAYKDLTVEEASKKWIGSGGNTHDTIPEKYRSMKVKDLGDAVYEVLSAITLGEDGRKYDFSQFPGQTSYPTAPTTANTVKPTTATTPQSIDPPIGAYRRRPSNLTDEERKRWIYNEKDGWWYKDVLPSGIIPNPKTDDPWPVRNTPSVPEPVYQELPTGALRRPPRGKAKDYTYDPETGYWYNKDFYVGDKHENLENLDIYSRKRRRDLRLPPTDSILKPKAPTSPSLTGEIQPIDDITTADDSLKFTSSPNNTTTNARPLEVQQLFPEMYTLATNRQEPVWMQQFTPELYEPYQVSFQDKLNEQKAQFKEIQKIAGNNPSALATLAGQEYAASSGVLGEEFRTNQQIANDITNKNLALLNEAKMTNLGLADQQYVRQSTAKSKTKEQDFKALDSISNKLLQREADNQALKVYENMYPYYRFDPATGQAIYKGPKTDEAGLSISGTGSNNAHTSVTKRVAGPNGSYTQTMTKDPTQSAIDEAKYNVMPKYNFPRRFPPKEKYGGVVKNFNSTKRNGDRTLDITPL